MNWFVVGWFVVAGGRWVLVVDDLLFLLGGLLV